MALRYYPCSSFISGGRSHEQINLWCVRCQRRYCLWHRSGRNVLHQFLRHDKKFFFGAWGILRDIYGSDSVDSWSDGTTWRIPLKSKKCIINELLIYFSLAIPVTSAMHFIYADSIKAVRNLTKHTDKETINIWTYPINKGQSGWGESW